MAIETVQKHYKGPLYTRKDWYSFFPMIILNNSELPGKRLKTYTSFIWVGLHSVNVALKK